MIRTSSRRNVLLGLAAFAASPAAALGQQRTLYDMSFDEDESGYDAALLPPPESPVDFPIEPVDMDDIPDRYHSQIVEYGGIDDPGTLVVDPANRFLYKVLGRGEALRYGVGVGRAGFAWAGEAEIAMKRRWPRWVPPREMVARDAKAAKWANGQPGGPDNPLGARALYLYANGVDTLYRIHGTNEPKSIGKAMSSGCIRMLNQDIAELYLEVPLKTRVVVLQSDGA